MSVNWNDELPLERKLTSAMEPVMIDLNELKNLAADAIRLALGDELSWYNQEGCEPEYKMSDPLKDLVRRAQKLGVGPLEPYEGYSHIGQATEPSPVGQTLP